MTDLNKNIPIGQLLVEKGIITHEQLELALKRQREKGGLLGVVLLEMGFVDEETVFLPALAGQFGVDYLDLRSIEVHQEAIAKIPPKFASYYKVFPVSLRGDTLTLATTTPLDTALLDELGVVVNARLHPVLAVEKDILEAIRKHYGVGAETIDSMMGQVPISEAQAVDTIDERDSEASISKFLNQILLEAYRDRATDIHIEPFVESLQIRYRIDGALRDAKIPVNLRHFKDALCSRIKILSNLNIAEKRKPQDGRFKARVGGFDIELRVSFLPTPYGESVVMRVLNSAQLLNFREIGLNDGEQTMMRDLIGRPHGIVFLTGPTGSGKTTTLYSCLSMINTEDKKVITIEDPIEYQLKGITQIQINPSVGLTFAQGLRSMLRHDPDIMMVGEVRDKETAEIAVQVALTGHLIFSTLHTNDAASGVARLMDMGVEPYLITSTIECFIAQRLVRVVCPRCRVENTLSPEVAQEFNESVQAEVGMKIYEARGCEHCRMTGYTGRVGIFEFLMLSDDIRQKIMERATVGVIKELAVRNGMLTLIQSGWEKVREGVTTPQEILRVTRDDE
jgi:type II secretory ATPase GspE/PulE/Tfp pilus assembly ATPase PilB-like protein